MRICETTSATTATPGASCARDGDCRSGLCEDQVCVALCSDRCARGYRCEPTAIERSRTITPNTCKVRLADWSVDLGPVATPPAGSDELTFVVPDATASFTIVLDDLEGLRVATRSLIAPDGTTIVDPFSHYPGTACALVPSSDKVEARARPGTWRLRVGTYAPAIFDLSQPVPGAIERVLVIFEPESELGGSLDLILHLAPALGVASATTARPITQLLGAVSRQLLDPASIALGDVEMRALDAEHDRVENGDETRAICLERSELGRHGTSINVFIVETLDYTRGHAGGVPGPPGIASTRASGIVIQHLGDWEDTGTLLAHELGHFLGLRHTSELTGGVSDPISDTSECPAGTSASDCPDYRNLMFPTFPLSGTLALTPGQLRVIAASPWLYE